MHGPKRAQSTKKTPVTRRKPRISKTPVWGEPSGWQTLPVAVGTATGHDVIRTHVRTVTSKPGVYRMLDTDGNVLYVGKAKNLKKRLTSYTRVVGQSHRIVQMVRMTASVEIIATHTEVEALLLEANLIKKLKPRYNIIFRDDKSFPYILLRRDHIWPQITKYRGSRNRGGEYFGPFASAGAVNSTINALQRAFPLRSCSDSVFDSRTRPCLQYQIRRCAAPCVGRIGGDDYAALVDETRSFLKGESQGVQRRLSKRMQQASESLDFETAAIYRDRIRALSQIQARQGINTGAVSNADVIAAEQQAGQVCLQVFFFRGGQNYGNRAYFPRHERNAAVTEVLTAFVTQFYSDKQPPRQILLSHKIEGHAIVEEALSIRAEASVRLSTPQRGEKRSLINHAVLNAREALNRRLAESASQRDLLDRVAELFGLEASPERIEVFDNSHVSGTNQVGSMIVAGPEGFLKNNYRKFNIRDETLVPGDDYGMMREVLNRRFRRLMKEDDDRHRGQWPDLILVDGGAGQLGSAMQIFADLGVADVDVVAISKGPDRNAGRERFFLPNRDPFSLPPNDPVLYFLQRLRDEAHRFAITAHRARRSRGITNSPLDEVQGIGAKRKRALLHHFGSARSVAQAGLVDLEKVDGINKTVAQTIYDHFHRDE
jgi:excinuclease ABC subunit C